MKKALGVTACLVGMIGLLAPACGGGDDAVGPGDDDAGADVTSTVDTGGGGDDTSPAAECTIDADCAAKIPVTTPADCAVATCDPLQKKCLFKAKDADGDGHPAKTCSATTATIQTGDDCDDNDPHTYPGAWDGPATDVDAGPGAEPDRCDQKDQDCNGTPDDGKITLDAGVETCKCDPRPDHELPCYEYPSGQAIDPGTLDGNGNPKGACKKGIRSCPGGVPGQCVGAAGPTQELCNHVDDDCNGTVDDVPGVGTWYLDADHDNHGDVNTTPVSACFAPDPSTWKQGIPNDDCNDGNPSVYPGATEYCGDGVDSNCTGGDSETYGNLNQGCTAGTFGVCRRTGTFVCNDTHNGTVCNATPGTATSGNSVPSSDPLIDMSQARQGYDPRWDWNCDNNVVVVDHLYDGSFRSAACGGNYSDACAQLGTSDSTCNAGVFFSKWYNCNHIPGTFFWYSATDNGQCGTSDHFIYCDNLNSGGASCDYIPSPGNGTVSCN